MVHVYGLGVLQGVPGSRPIAQSALSGLTGSLRDKNHGGWYSSMSSDGHPTSGKSCYDHTFVLLAATTAVQAELDGADELLTDAAEVFLGYFWDDAIGRCVDTWDSSFEQLDSYRGINANMHAVEAMLSVASLTSDVQWLERAARICGFVVDTASENGWRIPEHYDSSWQPVLDYNEGRPADPFKPFGATVGHALEWARLLVHLANSPVGIDRDALLDASRHLFDQAVTDGWASDGHDGFVYTTDWDGVPVVRDRFHWVTAEAIAAAAALYREHGDQVYADWYRRWWDYAATYHVDSVCGSWHHELDALNRPASAVWKGKPDLYHVFQAALVPGLPLYPMFACGLSHRQDRTHGELG